ncbi:hypothetical protein BGX38DRAFT_143509 [Terfezia claveryi]|nr:hypothetical protein BGX38DRAFT_143509 [Terfezia claveryi]
MNGAIPVNFQSRRLLALSLLKAPRSSQLCSSSNCNKALNFFRGFAHTHSYQDIENPFPIATSFFRFLFKTMASCESENFRSTSENQLVLSRLTECPMIPAPPKTGFAFQISGVPDHYPTTALTIIDQNHNFSLFSFVKEPEFVSCRLFDSSGQGLSSAPNSVLPMSESCVGKNTHHLQQPAQMPTFGATQISYGSLKKLTDTRGSTSESHSPSLRSPRYYSPPLTEVSASNREGLGGFQSPGYEHLTYSGPDNPFHSTSTSSSGSGSFRSGILLESNSPLSHHYQQDQRHGDSELYAQQTAVKLQLEPVKIECSHALGYIPPLIR